MGSELASELPALDAAPPRDPRGLREEPLDDGGPGGKEAGGVDEWAML
jgi:hypothetical protein